MARDKFHYNVKEALIKDGWIVAHDPFRLKVGEVKAEIDLGAEKIISAEKEGVKIAVEVKNFISQSLVSEFETAYGQFMLYRWLLSKIKNEKRDLYLAITEEAYGSFFQRSIIKEIVETDGISLIVFDNINNTIIQWIK